MEALLAPVALYPDAVLAQVFMSSTNPQEVLDAGNWLIANPEVEGKALDDATEKAGFTPPMRGLMQFRPIVDQMCLEMGWTTEIGQAFTNDQPGVLAAVQRLRSQAKDAGNLQDSPQMKVVEESQDGQEAIILEPQDPKVVYVPTYDPVAAYAPAPAAAAPAATTTTVTEEKGHSTGSMIATGVLAFGAGLLVSEIFDDDDDDYYHHGSPYYPNYHGGYYPPPPRPYHYNPVYGGGYRPGYSYNRPPSYNNVLSNNNVVVVNRNKNDDYWNNFDDRATGKPRARTVQSPITKAKPNRSELASVNDKARSPSAQNRNVQGSYAGASKEARAKAKLPPASKVTTGKAASNAAAATNKAPARAEDRGYAGARPATADTQKQPARQSSATPSASNRPKPPAAAQSAAHSRQASGPSAGGGHRQTAAAGHAQGSSDRAASQRGRSSMPQGAKSKSKSGPKKRH